MRQIGKINKYNVYLLDKELATRYVKTIATLADSIPLVSYSEDDILSESKKDRMLYGKWNHSLVVFDGDQPVAIIIGYERKAKDNDQYLENSIYISELAVDKNYQRQGIAKKLVELFLESNQKFLYLDGKLIFTIQTNSADWNKHVQNLYKSLGFKQVSTKEYDNRTDVILKLIPIIK
jgi:ribosomal protein S18 acetylase RimI-like enzyme